MTSTNRHAGLLLFSPILVIALGHLTARLTGPFLGAWCWVPLILVFWSTVTAILYFTGQGRRLRTWLQPAQGSPGWKILAMLVALIPLPIFLLNWHLLQPAYITLLWLAFGLINPWLEEAYWRGALLDASQAWPAWLSTTYSSAVFALSHPLMWGQYSLANRGPEVLLSTFLMGITWSWVYRKTRSLRWTIASHALVDLLGLSIPVFLNLYTPNIKH